MFSVTREADLQVHMYAGVWILLRMLSGWFRGKAQEPQLCSQGCCAACSILDRAPLSHLQPLGTHRRISPSLA